ncbi:glycosyltransferase family 2 protein [Anabaenopsis sp. FSS-46]|uniref:glycosyltransferase family 2 protein n=1 Tax=Anabaenopsis sp. FSS-46 TaxID=2971766 RepID=UPI00247343EA|nr:glycosyltransferase family 2 protein [Anabaenopsis sp. FSS-46]MDH6099438.1 glycosyltransferase family 2 protein [Anabaenopsis sp. FSS-46]
MLHTPVIFLIFRRPDLTAQVFEQIRAAKPAKLLVVADGPRNAQEAPLCEQARKVTEQIDWECEVLRNYSDINLGCRDRVSSGLTWAFTQVEEAIILEDDCLPHPSFFPYCQELLERYKSDTRIMQIGGTNLFNSNLHGYYQYFFSRHFTSWGWATWKRAWQHYDKDLHLFQLLNSRNQLANIWTNPNERTIRQKQMLDVLNNKIDSWAYIWSFSCAAQNAFSILPVCNLIQNIGFGLDATHTKIKDERAFLATSQISISTHPEWIYSPTDVEIERISRFSPSSKFFPYIWKKFKSKTFKFFKAYKNIISK